MYGTVGKFKIKEGMAETAIKDMDREEIGEGYIGHIMYQMDNDSNEFIFAVVFESKEAYHANAQRPETHQEFEKMMQYVDGEIHWNDGEIVFHRGLES